MSLTPLELHQLSLLIDRLLDSDALLTEDGTALRAAVVDARQSLAEGDAEAARSQIASLARIAEALVSAEALDLSDGRAVIQTARRVLDMDVQ